MRVLISAYSCNPTDGSEPYVGWTWALAAARAVDELHVVTRTSRKDAIESCLRELKVSNVKVHYVDLPKWARFWKSGYAGTQVYYRLWQYALIPYIRRLHRIYKFDLVHHVTFAGAIYPPGVAVLPVPFIWGPIASLDSPRSLRESLELKNLASELTHAVVLRLSPRVEPLVRLATRKAHVIIKIPNSTLHFSPTQEILEAGPIFIDPDTIPVGNPCPRSEADLRIISIYRFVYWKGGDLGIEAISELRRRGHKVLWTVIGDGAERTRWEELARKHGVLDSIRFLGNQPRSRVLQLLTENDVLLHLAYREGWGGAVLEGMAAKLPVVCLNWGGPGFIVSPECGFRVSVDQSRSLIIREVADALETLLDARVRFRMGEAARERVERHFSLKALDQFIRILYEGVMGSNTTLEGYVERLE